MEIYLNFLFDGNKEIIKCNKDEYMKDIFINYANKIEKNAMEMFFLYNGDMINEELKLEDVIQKKLNPKKKKSRGNTNISI